MIEVLSTEEFNNYSSNHFMSTFFQSSYWGELKKSNGWTPHIVGLKENGKIVGATLLLGKKIPVIGKYFYYAPRGFLIDYNDFSLLKKFTEGIKQYVKKNKGIFIKINPYLMYQERDVNGAIVEDGLNNKEVVSNLKKLGFIHNGFTINYGKDLEPRWLSVLDIKNKTEEEILKNMRGTTRWGIQNSYKHGLKLVEIDEKRLPEFKKLMEHTGERRGFIDRPITYYQKMYECFSKSDNIKVMLVELNKEEYLTNLSKQYEETENKLKIVKKEGARKELTSQLEAIRKKIEDISKIEVKDNKNIVVAGGLFMTFGRQVISLFGASYREYMKFNGQYFLNFEMIKYAIRNNYDVFNFFGITGEFDESSKMYGLFNFKRGFNANVVELIGEFNLITNKFYYCIYNVMFYIYRKMKRWSK